MLIHWIWFAQLEGISQRQKMHLLRQGFEPEELYNWQQEELLIREGMTPETAQALSQKDLAQARQIAEDCRQKGIGILTFRDAAFPNRLRHVEDGPVLLYYRGVLPDLEVQPVVAMVGTRKATPYGLRIARSMATQIAACGGLVVSGGALGVDAASMEGALAAGHTTVGVLGCGVDVVYPRSNRSLFERVCQKGCLLSEYPPGTKPEHWHFPQRNRIISGISHGVLVVEAPAKSGALITAHCALEQGRDVFAIPGNIDSAACEGSNALLMDGAQPVMTGWHLMQNYEPLFPDVVRCQTAPAIVETGKEDPQPDKKDIDNLPEPPYSCLVDKLAQLEPEERQLLSCIGPEPMLMDDLIASSQLPAGKVLRMMTVLGMKDLVVMHPGGRVSAKKE